MRGQIGRTPGPYPLKILLADDDSITRTLLARLLTRWGYDVVLASDGLEAMEALAHHPEIRLCILDWMMPGASGLEVCQKIRLGPDEPYVYTILLTARTETDDIVHGMRAGADDYLVKPCHPLELEVRLRSGCRVIELQENLIQARERLRTEATHDGLTGLLNRGAWLDLLARELARSERENAPLSVFMMDIDHFKAINDTHGHAGGDEVLIAAARRFRSALRTYDVVGRLGGEEFAVLLSHCDLSAAEEVGERVRAAFADVAFGCRGGQLGVTLSIGVATSAPGQRPSSDELVRRADEALYRAKAEGRNRVMAEHVGSLSRLRAASAHPSPLGFDAEPRAVSG